MITQLGRVDEVASGQWSLVTRGQLLEAGVSERRITGLLRSGVLRPVRRRVYALVGAPRSWQQTALAAVLAVGTAVAPDEPLLPQAASNVGSRADATVGTRNAAR